MSRRRKGTKRESEKFTSIWIVYSSSHLLLKTVHGELEEKLIDSS